MVFVTHDQVEAMTMADRLVVLEAGVIQQVGTPEQVYEQPANRFVAGFIGSPSMNFFPVRLEGGDAILADGRRLPLPSWFAALPPGEAILGIRPEGMAPHAGDAPGLAVQITLVEPLGSDTLVHFHLGDAAYVARVPPDLRPRLGDRLTLAADAAKMHLFDPASGVVLGRPA